MMKNRLFNKQLEAQAASLVLRKIADSLRAGQTNSFDKSLTIMESYGGLACEELAKDIRRELSENTTGKIIIVRRAIVNCYTLLYSSSSSVTSSASLSVTSSSSSSVTSSTSTSVILSCQYQVYVVVVKVYYNHIASVIVYIVL